MRRLLAPASLAALLALLCAGALRGGAATRPGLVRFSAGQGRLVLLSPTYRLTLSAESGALLELLDRRSGLPLLRGQNGCMWAAVASDLSSVGGCDAAGQPGGFSYRWQGRSSRLTLRYLSSAEDGRSVQATVEVSAAVSRLDLRLVLVNRWGRPLHSLLFPADLFLDLERVRAGYAPAMLPGLRLRPAFFERPGETVLTYPGRLAFADFLAVDLGPRHLALYGVNPPPAPLAPVHLGFIRNRAPVPCSGPVFCLTHVFQTWVQDGEGWASPLVRLRLGGSVADSLRAYRRENGLDGYPSLADKAGGALDPLVRAPLVKADPWKGAVPPFRDWPASLARLPSPALLHPVAFQPGGHDEGYPDFLPPDPRWGTLAEMGEAVASAHARGQLVMPYLNVSWWDDQAPSLRALPSPLAPADIALRTGAGAPLQEQYGEHNGYVVSPWAPYVRRRVEALLEEWSDLAADCLFFDQIGARPWRRDFNPFAPSPLAYADGWLSLFRPYRQRCLMVEDGWDRLAESFAGFHGSLLLLHRQLDWLDRFLGKGAWEPYPLALWLFHDKVLFYQHDLYEGTMTVDPEVLTFNLAFGFMLSLSWDEETAKGPWPSLVARLQGLLGPLYAGRGILAFRHRAPEVSETTFAGGYSLVANWSRTESFVVDGYRIAPLGFLARAADGTVLAAALGEQWGGVSFLARES